MKAFAKGHVRAKRLVFYLHALLYGASLAWMQILHLQGYHFYDAKHPPVVWGLQLYAVMGGVWWVFGCWLHLMPLQLMSRTSLLIALFNQVNCKAACMREHSADAPHPQLFCVAACDGLLG